MSFLAEGLLSCSILDPLYRLEHRSWHPLMEVVQLQGEVISAITAFSIPKESCSVRSKRKG
jgi:hypothetical protein